MNLAEATGASGNSTALVGAPDTVAKAKVEYCRVGATSLLIRGYAPLQDAEQRSAETIGTTSEVGRQRKSPSCDPGPVASLLAGMPMAIYSSYDQAARRYKR
jgi:alkanesulfonate monooxygenase